MVILSWLLLDSPSEDKHCLRCGLSIGIPSPPLHQVVVHCDIKPSNVLLDEDMNAHVGDFGIAKLLASDGKSVALTSAAGTVGYMPPEYGFMGRVSRRGDVYSYGILLLETFTRKKPTDRMFDGELNLRQWVSDAYRTRLFDILDANLFRDARADRVAAEEDHGREIDA
uniref:Protein kinase domain-containing protein n=1 Tax=Ananas comosus var. bracteatus TaxID=296719 RepID=A0A6V7NK86_ANACO|nr:unnamed protein product [Ananas comosus var. bracteatus]